MELDRKFVFEHPLSASSWKLPELSGIIWARHVYVSELHMCECGLQATDDTGRTGPVMKPTRILTNDLGTAEAMRTRCQGYHKHVVLLGGGRARRAAKYSDGFVDAVIKGFTARSATTWRRRQEESGRRQTRCASRAR